MIISRALQKLGLPRKNKSKHASERDTPEVQEERREFAEDVEPIEPKRLVFLDETGITTAMTPAYGAPPVECRTAWKESVVRFAKQARTDPAHLVDIAIPIDVSPDDVLCL